MSVIKSSDPSNKYSNIDIFEEDRKPPFKQASFKREQEENRFGDDPKKSDSDPSQALAHEEGGGEDE